MFKQVEKSGKVPDQSQLIAALKGFFGILAEH